MRTLKTMNSVGEIKREDLFGLNITDITQNQRKVYQIHVVLYIEMFH
jgi:hypothetical protein